MIRYVVTCNKKSFTICATKFKVNDGILLLYEESRIKASYHNWDTIYEKY